jgi:hypothetical protein
MPINNVAPRCDEVNGNQDGSNIFFFYCKIPQSNISKQKSTAEAKHYVARHYVESASNPTYCPIPPTLLSLARFRIKVRRSKSPVS